MSAAILAHSSDLISGLLAGLVVPALFGGILVGLFWLDAHHSANGMAKE
jgi:hypothetical protein